MEEVVQKAEEVAKKYNPQTLSPFPYENVLKDKKDLQIYLAIMDKDISGTISYNKDTKKFEIIINQDRPQTRQNFTLAHELGHYFLHQDILKKEQDFVESDDFLDGSLILFRNDVPSSLEIEREANTFAAALLMPEELVRRAWDVYRSIEECANLFQVSVVAMSIRLERLDLIT